MKRGSLGLLACVVGGVGLIASPPAPVFSTSANLVRVDFEIFNDQTPVKAAADDLVVRDEGRPQPVAAISEGQLPLDLVLLFDVSGSMESVVEKVAQTAEAAFRELRAGDRAAVLTFNHQTTLLLRFTPDLDRVLGTIRDRVVSGSFDGATHLLTAVDDAARYLLATPRGPHRRAILVITDNIGLRTRRESTVVKRLWEADASLHGLVINSGRRGFSKWYVRLTAPHVELLMQQGIGGAVARTGGIMLSGRDATGSLPELIRRIRARPTLFYVMPPGAEGKYRSIRLELTPEARRKNPKPRIYARRGYFVPGADMPPAGDALHGIILDEVESGFDELPDEGENEEEEHPQ